MNDTLQQLLKYPEPLNDEEFVKNIMKRIEKRQRLRQLILTLSTLFCLILFAFLDFSIDFRPIEILFQSMEQSNLATSASSIFSLIAISGFSIWLWIVDI